MLVCDMSAHDTIGYIDMLFDNPKGIVRNICREIEGAKHKLMSACEDTNNMANMPEDMRDVRDRDTGLNDTDKDRYNGTKDKDAGRSAGLEEDAGRSDDDESILPEDCPRAVQVSTPYVLYLKEAISLGGWGTIGH